MVMSADEMVRFKEWHQSFGDRLPTQADVSQWITDDRARQTQALEANRMQWALQNGNMQPRTAIEQGWAAKGYGLGGQEAITPEQVRAGIADIFTRRMPPEMMTSPVGEQEKQQLSKKAYDWVEPNLFATGGILKKAGLWEQYLSKMKAEGRPVTLTEKDFAKFEGSGGKGVERGEYRRLIDAETGEVIGESSKGRPLSEEFSPNVDIDEAFTKSMNRRIIDEHTHPDMSQASAEDLAMLGWSHVDKIRIKAKDGTIYEYSKPEGFKLTPRHIKDSWNKADNLLNDKLKEMDVEDYIAAVDKIVTKETGIQFKIIKPSETSDLLSTIRSLQRPGQDRELVSISQLRDKAGMKPEEFDAQLLQLAQEGKIALHQHDFAASLKPEERAKLLAVPNKNAYWGGHDFYVGVVPK